jgi:hypothetical protein
MAQRHAARLTLAYISERRGVQTGRGSRSAWSEPDRGCIVLDIMAFSLLPATARW